MQKLVNWLKENLDEERFYHSLGTAKCARELARKFNLDEEKAYLTGLLHDCAKCFSTEESIELLNKNDVDTCELVNPKTYHAPCGAILAKSKFGIDDEKILSAIECHTIGKSNMSMFEKIIFLADKIEANTRDAAWRKKILSVIDEEDGLNKSLLLCYEATIKSLVDRKLKICTSTIEIYNDLIDNLQT